MHARIRLQNRLLPILAGVVGILYALDHYRGWYVLLLGLGGALLLGYLWARLMAARLEVVHERRYGWAQVGDRLEERFELENHAWLPAAWVEIDAHSSMPGYAPGRAFYSPPNSRLAWTTSGVCTRRGLFTLGPTVLRSGDPLGLFSVEREYPATTTLLVAPPILPLTGIEIAPGGRAGDGRTRRPAFEESVVISHVREYAPGDGLRMIHWPTTARREALFVRRLDSTPASDWWIILDLDRRVQAGEGVDSTEERGVILAASLVELGLRRGHAVGLVTQAGGLAWHPPRFGEAHRQDLMRTLALAAPGEIPLGPLLASARPAIRGSPSLILVTANLAPDWAGELLGLVRRRLIPTVLLLDAPSSPDPGPLVRVLAGQGVDPVLVPAALFDRPEAQPGTQGRWVWVRAASSRAAAQTRPADQPWRKV